jgi:hypothetical protein
MAVWELALLFPPLARFFAGLLLVVIVVGLEVGFGFFVYSLYSKSEEEE